MATRQFTVEKFSVVSAKPFEDVLAGLERGIGRPNMSVLHEQMTAAPSFSPGSRLRSAEGPKGQSVQDCSHHRWKSVDHEANGRGGCGRRLLRPGDHSRV
jgi:hypothetical protein